MQKVFDNFDANRVGEIQALKKQLELLQRQQTPASLPLALPPPGAVIPAPSMAAPTLEFLEFFKTMEDARVKSVDEASSIQVAET